MDYHEPKIYDYGTLAHLTGDGAPLLMRQLGLGGAAADLATAPAAPGGGGGDVGGISVTPEAPRDAGGDVGAVGGEGQAPANDGGAGTLAEPGETGQGGVTAEGGGQVAGADELPFTGLDVAATAALGAATTAAGVALRKAVAEDAG